jgi:hypothetical protein
MVDEAAGQVVDCPMMGEKVYAAGRLGRDG